MCGAVSFVGDGITFGAVSFGVAAILIWSIRNTSPPRERATDRHLGRELKEGLTYLWQHKLLRSLCLLLLVATLVFAPTIRRELSRSGNAGSAR